MFHTVQGPNYGLFIAGPRLFNYLKQPFPEFFRHGGLALAYYLPGHCLCSFVLLFLGPVYYEWSQTKAQGKGVNASTHEACTNAGYSVHLGAYLVWLAGGDFRNVA